MDRVGPFPRRGEGGCPPGATAKARRELVPACSPEGIGFSPKTLMNLPLRKILFQGNVRVQCSPLPGTAKALLVHLHKADAYTPSEFLSIYVR